MRMLWPEDTEDYYLVRGVALRERLSQQMRLAVSEVCPTDSSSAPSMSRPCLALSFFEHNALISGAWMEEQIGERS